MMCPSCGSPFISIHDVTDDYDRLLYSDYLCDDCEHEWNDKPMPYVYKRG